jgi:L-alanine-DL-glutamate epimerase-like enolase superfamily enzyme
MKITAAVTQVVRLPADEPLAGGPAAPDATRDFVTLRLRTDAGLEGIGLTYFGAALTGALARAVDDLARVALGADPLAIEAVTERLHACAAPAGPGGVLTLALAAIDIALWDIKGKALGQPVAVLAGGCRERVPAYASGALMRHFPLEHCERAAQRLVEQGYRQMKTQLALPGDPPPAREVERIRRIRAAAGADVDLMCDINQRWSTHRAIDIGRRIEDIGLYWIEDVTRADDYAGLARVSAALATPVTGGEYLYGLGPFRQMLEARSVDIVMIDVLRAGGISGWLKIAALAEAFNLPVVSHLLPEIQLHTVAAVPNGLTVEFMPWSLHLYREPPQPRDGFLAVPQRPGLGLEFDDAALRRYAA